MIAAALLGEPDTGKEAARLLAGTWQLHAPAHWKAELGNVIWKAVRQGRLEVDKLDDILSLAQALPVATVDVGELWRGAVARAIEAGHPVYDALFVELAVRLGTHLVSYDGPLRRRFPNHVRVPGDLIAAR